MKSLSWKYLTSVCSLAAAFALVAPGPSSLLPVDGVAQAQDTSKENCEKMGPCDGDYPESDDSDSDDDTEGDDDSGDDDDDDDDDDDGDDDDASPS